MNSQAIKVSGKRMLWMCDVVSFKSVEKECYTFEVDVRVIKKKGLTMCDIMSYEFEKRNVTPLKLTYK
jgi:hypothetical protein